MRRNGSPVFEGRGRNLAGILHPEALDQVLLPTLARWPPLRRPLPSQGALRSSVLGAHPPAVQPGFSPSLSSFSAGPSPSGVFVPTTDFECPCPYLHPALLSWPTPQSANLWGWVVPSRPVGQPAPRSFLCSVNS